MSDFIIIIFLFPIFFMIHEFEEIIMVTILFSAMTILSAVFQPIK